MYDAIALELLRRDDFDYRNRHLSGLFKFNIEAQFQTIGATHRFLSNKDLSYIKTKTILTVNRESVALSEGDDHYIVVDLGFAHVCLVLYRIALGFIKIAEAGPIDESCPLFRISCRLGLTLQAEAAHCRRKDALALGITRAIAAGLPFVEAERSFFQSADLHSSDIEIVSWTLNHIILHELNHYLFSRNRVSDPYCRDLFANVVRNLRPSDEGRNHVRSRIKRQLISVNLNKSESEISDIADNIEAEDHLLQQSLSDNYDALVEIACDIQAVRDHYTYFENNYRTAGAFSREQLKNILIRPILIQYLIYYAHFTLSLVQLDLRKIGGDAYLREIASASRRHQAGRLYETEQSCAVFIKGLRAKWMFSAELESEALWEAAQWREYLNAAVFASIDPNFDSARARQEGFEKDALAFCSRNNVSEETIRAMNLYEFTPDCILKRYLSGLVI